MTVENLYRLVYYSRNRLAGPPAALGSQIETILTSSQANNAPVGVTGALMFNAGCFAQVLEGKREVVESIFERIQQDDRHSEVSVIAFEPIEARSFANWSMGFVGARPGDAARFANIGEQSGFDPSRADGDQVLQKLRQLAVEDELLA